ncbi:MAG TPA: hypothetical protein VKO83_13390 [Steroidobacteraceae bacterium]|nr:hypothetical protein [Steroidobacteraceae bacterium]
MSVEAPIAQRVALVAGGTGLTGRVLLKLLLTGGDYARILAVTRRPVPLDHPRLANRILPLEQIQAKLTGIRVNDAFCCLGAPQARAGTTAQLKAVDLDLTMAFARTALGLGATRLVVVSAAGAASNAASDFLRVKAELEAALRELRFAAVDILAPGHVTALRPQMGAGDWIGMLRPLLNPLLRGSLAVHRSVAPADLAAAMLGAARLQRGGAHVYSGTSLQELAEAGLRRT